MEKPDEFDCIDCGVHVFAYNPHEQYERCHVCQWISQLPEKDREPVRTVLIDRGVIERRADAAG